MLKFIPVRIVIWQLAIGILGAGVWLALAGPREALAAFFGGAIGALLSLYFAIRVFKQARGSDPHGALRAFYRAQAMKTLLAVGLFTVVAVYFADVFLPLITVFIASLSAYWFALLWDREIWNKHGERSSDTD